MSNLVAIDPGKAGALCLMSAALEVVETRPMPLLKDGSLNGLAILETLTAWDSSSLVLENQLAFKGRAAASLATTFKNVGVLEGIGLCAKYTVYHVGAQQWQRYFQKKYPGLTPPEYLLQWKWADTKLFSLTLVSHLYPEVCLTDPAKPRKVKPLDGVADSILIARYYQEQCTSTVPATAVTA